EILAPRLVGVAGWGSTRGLHGAVKARAKRRTPTGQHLLRSEANAVDLPLSGGGMEFPPCQRAICDYSAHTREGSTPSVRVVCASTTANHGVGPANADCGARAAGVREGRAGGAAQARGERGWRL